MTRLIRAALFGLLVLTLWAPRAAFSAPLFVIEENSGTYSFYNNSENLYVYGFIVGNSSTNFAFTTNDQWQAMVITAADWNTTGVQLQYGSPGGPVTLFDSTGLGLFSNYFGSDTKANAYWIASYISPPIAPLGPEGSPDSRYHWSPFLVASEYIVLGPGLNNILEQSLATSEVPVPAALPLFASGLGILGLLGWRRKKKAKARAA